MPGIFNKLNLRKKRKDLRKEMPLAELILWNQLRGKQLRYKFRRQHSIGNYIVDFYCPGLKLVIEVDGDSHFGRKERKRDIGRQRYIEQLGIEFLRVTNLQVYENLDYVMRVIEERIEELVRRNSPPFEGGDRGGHS